MDSPSSEYICEENSDDENDDENDAELLRLLINERGNVISGENSRLVERSDDMKGEYYTLGNLNPEIENQEIRNDTQTFTALGSMATCEDFGECFPEFESAVAEMFVEDENIELQLADITDVMTRFSADEYKNTRIVDLSKQIESNISECRELTMEAKVTLSQKLNLQRELNSLNEQIAFYTMEGAKYRRIQKRRGTESARTGSYRRTYFCRFGIPYFKTKDRFPAEQNVDLREIIQNNEIMVIRMPSVRRILPHDTRMLDTSILNQLKVKRIQQLQLRLKQLVKKEDGNDSYEQQALNLRRAIDHTKSVNDIRGTKDWDIPVDFSALTKLNPRFTVEDYERMWQLLGHPNLSREDFSKEELVGLKHLVQKYDGQDWDRIGRELNTNRSGFVCFNKWVISTRKGTREPWTKKEDDLLRKLCSKLDQIKDSANLYHWWRYIRRQFPHRTYTQIHGHWTYKLAPSLKKGRFTESETQKLEHLIHEGKSFGEIASIFQTRSSVQLRSHYNQIVERASHNSGLWTNEEEIALFQLIEKYGTNNWVQISKELGSRNRSQCRLKYLQGAWNPEETQKFQALLEKYGTDFEKISQELSTKKAGQCRLRYLRQKDSEPERPFNEGRWTRKENRIFRELVEKYKDDFLLISQELKTRSAEQCQEKYERIMLRNATHPIKKIEVKILDGEEEDKILNIYQNETKLSPKNRTSRWTQCEKKKFKELLKEYGCQFNKISDGLGSKSIQQCRNMYKKINNEIQESFVTDEDKEINRPKKRRKSSPSFIELVNVVESDHLESVSIVDVHNQMQLIPNGKTGPRNKSTRKRKTVKVEDPLKVDVFEEMNETIFAEEITSSQIT